MPSLLVVLAMKTLVTPHGVSSHFVWSIELWLIFYLFQDLMYWLLEHRVYHLRSYRPRLPSKIPSGPVIVVPVQLEIPHLLRDNLILSFALLLVFLDLLVLINTIHKLTNTPYRLLGQGFSQIMPSGQVDLEGPYSHAIKIPINLVKHLNVTTKVLSCGWMVPILSSFEKLSASRISTLAFFGSKLESSTGNRATDIILEE